MFVMIDLRGTGLGAEDFAWRLLVAVLAADTFGPSAAGHVRITFAVADAKLAEAQRGQYQGSPGEFPRRYQPCFEVHRQTRCS